jgi:hypothetical protein
MYLEILFLYHMLGAALIKKLKKLNYPKLKFEVGILYI